MKRAWEARRLRREPGQGPVGAWMVEGRFVGAIGGAWRADEFVHQFSREHFRETACEQREPYGRRPSPRPAPAFVLPRLLDGDIPEVPPAELALIVETEMLQLGACEARLDLDLGRALRACGLSTVQELGFSGLESYFPEVLGFAPRLASQIKTLTTRLDNLPRLREAFLAGALPRSRVDVACRVATPETELRWLLACVRHSTRELEAMARSEKQRARRVAREDSQSQHDGSGDPDPESTDRDSDPDSDPESAEELTRLRLPVRADDLSFIQLVGVPMLQAVVGVSGPMHVLFEALAADMLAELGPEPEIDMPGVLPAPSARGTARPGRVPKLRGACELAAQLRDERDVRRMLHRWRVRLGGRPAVAWPVGLEPDQMSSPDVVHARLVQLATWRHGLTWQRGKLLSLFQEHQLWRDRGHASFHQWCERRFGLSPKDVSRLIRLSQQGNKLPELDTAWREGRVGDSCVALLRQVAEPDTESEWLRLSREASLKRVELEVAAQQAARSRFGLAGAFERTGGLPQWDKPASELLARWDDEVERQLRSRRARKTAMPGRKAPAPDSPYDLDGSLSDRGACERDLLAGPSLGRRRATLAFDAPAAVEALIHAAVRQVGRAIGWALDVGGCLVVMFHRFAETHVVPGLEDRAVRARVLRRDGWRCFMPRCRSRKHLDVHHVKFRSHGGSNAMWNLITLCHRCHSLLHEGQLSLSGKAPSALLVRMGRAAPCRLLEWFREGIRLSILPDAA